MAPSVIRAADHLRSERGTIAFGGEGFGSEVSVYLIEYRDIGDGPGLHKHPMRRRGSFATAGLGSRLETTSLRQARATYSSDLPRFLTCSRTWARASSTSCASIRRLGSFKRISFPPDNLC